MIQKLHVRNPIGWEQVTHSYIYSHEAGDSNQNNCSIAIAFIRVRSMRPIKDEGKRRNWSQRETKRFQ